jgi:hypothetical protein
VLAGICRRAVLPAGFPRELGAAIERVWDLRQRTRRMAVLNEVSRLGVSVSRSTELAGFTVLTAPVVAEDLIKLAARTL